MMKTLILNKMIKTENKATIEFTMFHEDGKLKTHNTDTGNWYGDELCSTIDITSVVADSGILNGEYKVVITLEKVQG